MTEYIVILCLSLGWVQGMGRGAPLHTKKPAQANCICFLYTITSWLSGYHELIVDSAATAHMQGQESIYIGLYRMDEPDLLSYGYAWIDTGINSARRYSTSWTHESSSRNCAVMKKGLNYYWDTYDCNSTAAFVCKKQHSGME